MDFTPGLRVARRYWLGIVLVGFMAAAVAYAASYLVSPSYSSSTRVLVRAREARFLTSTGQDLSARPGALEFIPPKSLNQTLAGLVTSRPVAEQVVHELRLDQRKADDSSLLSQLRSTLKGWYRVALAYLQYGYYAEPSAFEGAVTELQRNLEATPIKDSYLIEIRARADEPDLAAAIADAATRSFVEETRAQFQQNASSYRTFLADETERARIQVEGAEDAVRRYKELHGITDISEELRLKANREESVRRQLQETEADLGIARARRSALQDALSKVSPTESSTSNVVGRNTATTSNTLETGRSVSTTINETTSETSETREGAEPNRVYQEILRSALVLDADIAGLQAKRGALAAELDAATRAAGALAEHAARLSELDLQRTAAHGAFITIQAGYETALLNDARGAEEVRQVEEATVPLYPQRPLRYLFALLGLLCGLAGGVGLGSLLDRYGQGWAPSLAPRSESPLLGPAAPAAMAESAHPAPRFEG